MPMVKKENALDENGKMKDGIVKKQTKNGKVYYFKNITKPKKEKKKKKTETQKTANLSEVKEAMEELGLSVDCVKQKCITKTPKVKKLTPKQIVSQLRIENISLKAKDKKMIKILKNNTNADPILKEAIKTQIRLTREIIKANNQHIKSLKTL